MSDADSVKDTEKHAPHIEPVGLDGAPPAKVAAFDGPFRRWAKAMAATGMEVGGMDRIQPDQRLKSNGWSQILFWYVQSAGARPAWGFRRRRGLGAPSPADGWPDAASLARRATPARRACHRSEQELASGKADSNLV